MLIVSLHQSIGNWATTASKAWKEGSYCSALLYSIIARVGSAAGVIFQTFYSLIHLVDAVSIARQTFSARRLRSTSYAILIAIKTSLLALTILIYGLVLSTMSIFIPELTYNKIKAQKLLYAQHIIRHLDCHEGLTPNSIQNISQHLSGVGLQLDENSFQEHFRAVWLRSALAMNLASEFGQPDAQESLQQGIEVAISEYVMQQLQVLEEVDPEHYQEMVQRRPQPRGGPQRPQAVPRVIGTYSQSCNQLGRIFFIHIQEASKNLHERGCYNEQDLDMPIGGAYNAVVGLAIMRMIEAGRLSSPHADATLELTTRTHAITFNARSHYLNLGKSFIVLKKLISQLADGRQGQEKQRYDAAHQLLIARLSFPEARQQNESIEQQRNQLAQHHPQIADLEANIFKQIGALIGIMNQRIINARPPSEAQKIDWAQAFKVPGF